MEATIEIQAIRNSRAPPNNHPVKPHLEHFPFACDTLSMASALKSGPVLVLLPFLEVPGPGLVPGVSKFKKIGPEPQKTSQNWL